MMRTLAEVRRPADTHIAALGSSLEELRRDRLELAEKVAGLTWDLGGLTYEMAVRDHYRLDVLARRAAELQEADAQLGEVERLLAAAEDGIHGTCRACGSVHSRGAAFCWHCGATLLADSRPSVLGEPGDSVSLHINYYSCRRLDDNHLICVGMLLPTSPLTPSLSATPLKSSTRCARLLGQGFTDPRAGWGRCAVCSRPPSIESSTSIEGFHVSAEDTLALFGGEEQAHPTDVDRLAVACYGRAMDHVAAMAIDPVLRLARSRDPRPALRGLLISSPGEPRPAGGAVRWDHRRDGVSSMWAGCQESRSDGRGVALASGRRSRRARGRTRRHGPSARHLDPSLSRWQRAHLAHRAVARSRSRRLLSAEFGSIEEYLGENTLAYYAALQSARSAISRTETSPVGRFCIERTCAGRRRLARLRPRGAVASEELVQRRGWRELLVIGREQRRSAAPRALYAGRPRYLLPLPALTSAASWMRDCSCSAGRDAPLATTPARSCASLSMSMFSQMRLSSNAARAGPAWRLGLAPERLDCCSAGHRLRRLCLRRAWTDRPCPAWVWWAFAWSPRSRPP